MKTKPAPNENVAQSVKVPMDTKAQQVESDSMFDQVHQDCGFEKCSLLGQLFYLYVIVFKLFLNVQYYVDSIFLISIKSQLAMEILLEISWSGVHGQ
jgi:hypothetical protein